MTLPFEPGPADRMLAVLREHKPDFSPAVKWLRLLERRYEGVDLEAQAYLMVDWLQSPKARQAKRKLSLRFVDNWLLKTLADGRLRGAPLPVVTLVNKETGEVLKQYDRKPEGGYLVKRLPPGDWDVVRQGAEGGSLDKAE